MRDWDGLTYSQMLERVGPYLHLRALDAEQTGAMVALVPSDADAARLVTPSGEPAGQLHVTLAFLGEAAGIDPEVRAFVVNAMRGLVEGKELLTRPVSAQGFAVSVFNPDGPAPCIVLGLTGAELSEVQSTVMSWLYGVPRLELPEQHVPWLPHITLIYSGDAALVGPLLDRVGPVKLDRLRVAFAGQATDIELGGGAAVGAPTYGSAVLAGETVRSAVGRYLYGWPQLPIMPPFDRVTKIKITGTSV